MAAATLFVPHLALAEAYKQIRIVVPFAAGGASDAVARAIGTHIGESLKTTVLVDNKPGGGGVIGAGAVLASKADGGTLFMASNGSMIINPVLRNDLRYNPDKDFVLVAAVARAPIFIWARADLPAKSVAELVQLGKKGPLSAGSAGTGNITHLAIANVASLTGMQLNHVPFSGDAPALSTLAGGTLDLSFNSLIAAQPLLQAGRIRPVAILDDKRDPSMPDVPTLAESGYSGALAAAWFGLTAPAGTPEATVAELNKVTNDALARADVKERLRTVGFTPLPGSVALFQQMYDAEAKTWRPLVKKLGLRAD